MVEEVRNVKLELEKNRRVEEEAAKVEKNAAKAKAAEIEVENAEKEKEKDNESISNVAKPDTAQKPTKEEEASLCHILKHIRKALFCKI